MNIIEIYELDARIRVAVACHVTYRRSMSNPAQQKKHKPARAIADYQEVTGPATAPRRTRRPKEVRERVLAAALHAFAVAGFEGASTRAIANDAQVSLSLLMYHFKNKDELWRAVLQDIASMSNMEQLLAGANEGMSAAEKLMAVIRGLVHLFAEFPELHRLMTLEAHQPSERLNWIIENINRTHFDAMCALIAEAQAEGAVLRISPERLRFAIFGMAAVPFSVSAEYQFLTKRNPFSKIEIEATIEMICKMIFI